MYIAEVKMQLRLGKKPYQAEVLASDTESGESLLYIQICDV